ncbi:hypothetical protein ISN44_As07g002280, partial [Arabidopsis suecica]
AGRERRSNDMSQSRQTIHGDRWRRNLTLGGGSSR